QPSVVAAWILGSLGKESRLFHARHLFPNFHPVGPVQDLIVTICPLTGLPESERGHSAGNDDVIQNWLWKRHLLVGNGARHITEGPHVRPFEKDLPKAPALLPTGFAGSPKPAPWVPPLPIGPRDFLRDPPGARRLDQQTMPVRGVFGSKEREGRQ